MITADEINSIEHALLARSPGLLVSRDQMVSIVALAKRSFALGDAETQVLSSAIERERCTEQVAVLNASAPFAPDDEKHRDDTARAMDHLRRAESAMNAAIVHYYKKLKSIKAV